MDLSREQDTCLEAAAVQALLDGGLAPVEAARAREHLEDCAVCCEWVARVADMNPGLGRADPESERFNIIGEVGRGGMGVVYEAHDDVLGRRVALKAVVGAGGVDSQRRLAREARAMAKLRHPNVVPVYDVVETDDELYVVMDFVVGRTLRSWLRERERPWKAVVRCLLGAARGLVAAHQAGLVHRDFKPENVLIDEAGVPLVADFGTATEMWDETLGESPSESVDAREVDGPITRPGAGVGTPAYAPPEQVDGHTVDLRADIFAFCVTAWEALHGERPFAESSLPLRMLAIERGEVRPPKNKRLPRKLNALLRSGLSARADERPDSMASIIDGLESLLARRRLWLGGTVLAVVGASSAGLAAAASSTLPCEEPEDGFAQVWTVQGRAAIETGFSRGSALRWAQIAAGYDRFDRRSRAEFRRACEMRRDGELEAAASWAMQRCVLEIRAQADVFARCLMAKGESCYPRLELLRVSVPCEGTPVSPLDTARDPRSLATVSAHAAALRVAHMTGAQEDVTEEADALLASLGPDAELSLVDRVRLASARIRGPVAPDEVTFIVEAVAARAEERGDLELALAAYGELANHHVTITLQDDEAMKSLTREAAIIQRLQPGPFAARAAVDHAWTRGLAHSTAGRTEQGRIAFETALAEARSAAPEVIPHLLAGVAASHLGLEQPAEAQALFHELIAWHQAEHSSQNPWVPDAWLNLAVASVAAGDIRTASDAGHNAADQLVTGAPGLPAVETGYSLLLAAGVLLETDGPDVARTVLDRSAEMLEDAPLTVRIDLVRTEAAVSLATRDYAAILADVERARPEFEGHLDLERALDVFEGTALTRSGETQQACDLLCRIDPSTDELVGPAQLEIAVQLGDEGLGHRALRAARADLASMWPGERAWLEALATQLEPDTSTDEVRATLERSYETLRSVAHSYAYELQQVERWRG